MKVNNLAFFGAMPKFSSPLPVGQLYFPGWERYKSAFREIFERQYYTNQGPLTQELENKIEDFLGVKNAICVSNGTIGLMMVAEALEISGKVILPSFTFVASAQALVWSGLKPLFCDVDADTHQIDHRQVLALIDNDVGAILGVNLWGGACDLESLEDIGGKKGVQVFFDSAHGFGCVSNGLKLGNYGRAEIFSFHATKLLNATEGGCICTNDDELADRLRNIRSSYGVEKKVDVAKTSNGRMSEAQAAIALMSLEDFNKNREHNKKIYDLYCSNLQKVPGLKILKPSNVSTSNHQYVVCMIEESEFRLSRDILLKLLRSENILARRYFYPGLHNTIPFKFDKQISTGGLMNTDYICATCLQLPIGGLVAKGDVEIICNIINNIHDLSVDIRLKLEQ